jgi:5'-nucleotidase / UDP-sugar diphosphatase
MNKKMLFMFQVMLLGILFLFPIKSFTASNTALQKHHSITQDIIVLNTGDIHEFSHNLSKIEDYVKRISKSNKDKVVILLDAGDLMDHNPSRFRKTGDMAKKDTSPQKGEKIYRWASQMDYKAMVLGNHDLTGGVKHTQSLIKEFKLPVVGANIKHPNLDIPPYTIVESNLKSEPGKLRPLKIGIIGFVDQEKKDFHMSKTDKKRLDVYRVNTDTCKKHVGKLAKECDVIIFLSHNWDDIDRQYLAGMNGSEVIIGGHSHKKTQEHIPQKVCGKQYRYLTKSGWKGEAVGTTVIRCKWDSKNKKWNIIKVVPGYKRMSGRKVSEESPAKELTLSL